MFHGRFDIAFKVNHGRDQCNGQAQLQRVSSTAMTIRQKEKYICLLLKHKFRVLASKSGRSFRD